MIKSEVFKYKGVRSANLKSLLSQMRVDSGIIRIFFKSYEAEFKGEDPSILDFKKWLGRQNDKAARTVKDALGDF
ncbi:MAG: hypothetical protein WCQ96_03660 [Patescibacteria group bacterium]